MCGARVWNSWCTGYEGLWSCRTILYPTGILYIIFLWCAAAFDDFPTFQAEARRFSHTLLYIFFSLPPLIRCAYHTLGIMHIYIYIYDCSNSYTAVNCIKPQSAVLSLRRLVLLPLTHSVTHIHVSFYHQTSYEIHESAVCVGFVYRHGKKCLKTSSVSLLCASSYTPIHRVKLSVPFSLFLCLSLSLCYNKCRDALKIDTEVAVVVMDFRPYFTMMSIKSMYLPKRLFEHKLYQHCPGSRTSTVL